MVLMTTTQSPLGFSLSGTLYRGREGWTLPLDEEICYLTTTISSILISSFDIPITPTLTMAIIVTGCQRSGTTITAHILANRRDYVLFEDEYWSPNLDDILLLKQNISKGIDNVVIQSPAALQNFHSIHHLIPSLHWVGVKRDKEEIISSMKRIKWMQDLYPDYIPYYLHHIRYMNNLWGLLKQLLPKENWTEVKYPDELSDYPEFIQPDLRKDFYSKQIKLNTPKGPKYWTQNPTHDT